MDMNAIINTERMARDRLAHSLKGMVKEAEQMLKTAQREGNDEFNAARDKFTLQIEHAKSELTQLEDDAAHGARRAIRVAAHTVHDHPYATIGIAAGICALIGVLASRR